MAHLQQLNSMRRLKVLGCAWICFDLDFELSSLMSLRRQPRVQTASVEPIPSDSVQVLDHGGNISSRPSMDCLNAIAKSAGRIAMVIPGNGIGTYWPS